MSYLKKALDGPLCDKLLRLLPDMSRLVQPATGRPEYCYPQLAGSHLTEVGRG